ncbi:MAG: site-2 protease family protein [Candidatus Dormiibacterota bacterium]
MREQIHLATIAGIRIGANWSVLVVLVLIAWSLAANLLPDAAPGNSAALYWAAAIGAAVLFLASITIHELAHSLVARRLGVGVEGITLWMFGGVSTIEGEAPSAGAEAKIAFVGPLTSFILAAVFGLANVLLAAAGAPAILTAMTAWLAVINFVLGLFNLVPGFPLDGGRLLRAILWGLGRERDKATVRAAVVGQLIGIGMMAIGLLLLFTTRDLVGGLWLIFLGWILRNAASAERSRVEVTRALLGVSVGDLMTPQPVTVPAAMPVDEFLATPRPYRFATFPVVDANDDVEGLVSLRRMLEVPAPERATTTLGSIATGLAGVPTAAPDEKVTDLLQRLGNDVNKRVLVLQDGRLVGILSPHDISRALYWATQRGERPAA